jgi:signal transduction histidine kinase
MDAIAAFFMDNIVYVYFFYGLAFVALGLVVLLESGRASEFRFARALLPLALFGFLHGAHEWFEMFQIFAAHGAGYTASLTEEIVRITTLVGSFLLLLAFGMRLLPGAEAHPRAAIWQVAGMGLLWLFGTVFFYWRLRPDLTSLFAAADVLARYTLAIPGSLFAAVALLRERRDFHARGMSQYGQALLWAAFAFVIYGAIGQLFTRPSVIAPSQVVNTALFLRAFGIPIQLLRGLAAAGIALALGSSLRAFEHESRLRLARANKARLEAQAAALEAQQRRANEVEALNVELTTAARELSSLVEMSRILTSTMDLRRLTQDALQQIVHSFTRGCCAVVLLRSPDGALEQSGEYRRPGAPAPVTSPPLREVAAKAAEDGWPALAGLDGQVVRATPEALAERTYRVLGAPLQAKDQVFGGIAVASIREDEPLGAYELRLLTAFSQQLATAVENARLYLLVQERETRLEDLVRQLVNAQEGERQRISRELHDETGQKLSALGMGLAAVERQLSDRNVSAALQVVQDLRDLNDLAITELRNIMADLRPAQLDDLGLVPALRWYVTQYASRHDDLLVNLDAGRLPARLPPQHETVLFRAAQEALTNIARHAQAKQVRVSVHQEDDRVCLEVLDDGIGFDVSAPPRHAPGSGLGLVGMQERVALVDGEYHVYSQPGRGTRIVVQLPVTDIQTPEEEA